MENRRILNCCLFFGFLSFYFFPFPVLAYNDQTTHPALTKEIVKFFNKHYRTLRLNSEKAFSIIKGSIEEDSGVRWLHHFYDPLYQRGLVLEREDIPKNPHFAFILSGARSEWKSAKEWATADTLQGGVLQSLSVGIIADRFSAADDYSWERAIYDYAWKDEARGLESLGHILHLLEDMTVPDHTRNDPHPHPLKDPSPYERWTNQFDPNTISAFDLSGKNPITLTNIGSYFENISRYSNNNFFSEDTILAENYINPLVKGYKQKIIDGIGYSFGYTLDEEGNPYELMRVELKFGGLRTKYTLEDPKDVILNGYWSHLSEQAVLHGAGVIKLFFDEVENERRTKVLYNKNRSLKTKMADFAVQQVLKAGIGLFNIFGSSSTSENTQDLAFISASAQLSDRQKESVSQQPESSDSVPETQDVPGEKTPDIVTVPPPPSESLSQVRTVPNQTVQPVSRGVFTATSIILGGGGVPAQLPIGGQSSGGTGEQQETDVIAPEAPVILISHASTSLSTSTSILFSGTAEASSTILASVGSSSVVTSASGTWSLLLSQLPQGTTTILFVAKDQAGNVSSPVSRVVFIDAQIPDVSLIIGACAQSLSPDACLVATTTVTLSWSSSSSDASSYDVSCLENGAPCDTFPSLHATATQVMYVLPHYPSSYVFSVVAMDSVGNQSGPVQKEVSVSLRPVIINEIAWSGTGGSAVTNKDEWLEIYNTTAFSLDLSGMTLRSVTDGGPTIALSGTVASHGFYLIERTDDAAIADITANMTASFGNGLSNGGEVLALEYGSTTLDKTPASCGVQWCWGTDDPTYATMERYDPLASGEDPVNWGTWPGFAGVGVGAENQPISGTPGARNGMNYLLIPHGVLLTASTTLKADNSPYVIPGGYIATVAGTVLTVEPGVTVKFGSGAFLVANGSLHAAGTNAQPVVFTSFADDAYAGDLNRDASTTIPQPGDWGAIQVLGTDILLDHAIVRYGGSQSVSTFHAMLYMENASAAITDSVLEFSDTAGVVSNNTSGTIARTTIKNNQRTGEGIGLKIDGGSIVVSDNTIRNNDAGVFVTGGAGSLGIVISGNSIGDNAGNAITIQGAYPSLAGNTATGNGSNGISIGGIFDQDFSFSRDLPYVINATVILESGHTFDIPAGVVMKFHGNGYVVVKGLLQVAGTADNPVIFTSYHDDECGLASGCGDTNNATTSAEAGDWSGIEFRDTAASSSLDYIVIRYGGNKDPFSALRGALRVNDASIGIRNAVVEKSFFVGIRLEHSASTTIASSLIQDQQDGFGGESTGLMLLSGSGPAVSGTIFRNNQRHVFADATSSYLDDGGNIFE